MECQDCCTKLKFIETPDITHYGKEVCAKCGQFYRWVGKPKNKDKRKDKNSNWRERWKDRGFICGMCGATEEDYPKSSQWELDHVIPLLEGGEDKFENTMMLCKYCHSIKNSLQYKRKAVVKVGKKEHESPPWEG